MHHWIFQAVPDRYDLREQLTEGACETWYATRYFGQMESDDIVWFWQGGVPKKERGIYAWGRLTSEAYIKKNWGSHGVDVQVEHILPHPVTVAEFTAHRVLRNMLILRMAIGTNFLLSDKEAAELVELCQKVFSKSTPLPPAPGE